MADHPAVFSAQLMPVFDRLLPAQCTLIDPFAGTGKVHELGRDSWGIELEPEWAEMHPRTLVGNALQLPFCDGAFEAALSSPTYASRMADHHTARDSSIRHTYRHTLGRALHPENSGQMQWGKNYRKFHQAAWTELWRVLAWDAVFILNIKDHYRDQKRKFVTEWHIAACERIGFVLERNIRVPVRSQKHGANRKRVPYETVLVFRVE